MIRAVAFDETMHWGSVAAITGRVVAIYVFDDAEATYLCETTPSRWLQFVYNRFENRICDDDGELIPALRTGDTTDVTQYEFEDGGEAGMYVGCTSVDQRPTIPVDGETVEEAVEGLLGNWIDWDFENDEFMN